MSSQNTLLIERICTSSGGICVHYDFENTTSRWLIPGEFAAKRLNVELVLLYFLVSNCDIFTQNYIKPIRVDFGRPVSKGFSDFLKFVLFFENSLLDCIKLDVSETNYFSGISRQVDSCLDDVHEEIAGAASKRGRSVNLNVVTLLMEQIFRAISISSSSIDLNVPRHLIWNVFDSRKAFASGWPASTEGLSSVALALHEVFGLKLNLTNSSLVNKAGDLDYSARYEDIVWIANFSSDPEYFLGVFEELDGSIPEEGIVPEGTSKATTRLGELLHSMNLGDRNKYRSGLTCLPNGIEALMALRLSQAVNFQNNDYSTNGELGDFVFWTPRGHARLGHRSSRIPVWRSVF